MGGDVDIGFVNHFILKRDYDNFAFRATQDEILKNLENMGISDVEPIAGDVVETTKAYRDRHLGFRVALLYLDVDNFEGTLGALDEYAHRGRGEADAVDQFLKDKNVTLTAIPWANTLTAYFMKP